MRGEVSNLAERVLQPGITPACAGRSGMSCTRSLSRKDHPRVCGEKSSSVAPIVKGPGSPPRVRGEDRAAAVLVRLPRITPACAGRRCSKISRTFSASDHPRVCGEKLSKRKAEAVYEGSPPRVRGEVPAERGELLVCGITPACAGRSPVSPQGFPQSRDHPRVCGEKTKKIPNISRFYPGAACFSFSFS